MGVLVANQPGLMFRRCDTIARSPSKSVVQARQWSVPVDSARCSRQAASLRRSTHCSSISSARMVAASPSKLAAETDGVVLLPPSTRSHHSPDKVLSAVGLHKSKRILRAATNGCIELEFLTSTDRKDGSVSVRVAAYHIAPFRRTDLSSHVTVCVGRFF